MNFGDDAGFVVSVITSRDGSERVGGVAFEDGAYRHLTEATIETDWVGDDKYHEEMRSAQNAAQS